MPLIKPVSGGVELPELTNPATAENIQTGFEAINGDGEKVTGTHEEAEIPELPALANPATAAQILSEYDAINGDGNKVSGSMVNNGAVSQALNCGGEYTVPQGYHDGTGKVTANSLASQTVADAAAADIMSGKSAWVNGEKVTGEASAGAKYEIISVASGVKTASYTLGRVTACIGGMRTNTATAAYVVSIVDKVAYNMQNGGTVTYSSLKITSSLNMNPMKLCVVNDPSATAISN